jgi:glycosyltransferase involved in cell wall biosynthesis
MLVLPALLALVFIYVRVPSWQLLASIAAAAGAMTLIHPPHSALVLIVLAGFLAARALLYPQDLGALATAVAAVAVPTAAVGVWLLPILRETSAHNPGHAELRRAFHYPYELDVFAAQLRLTGLFGRTGAVAVAALVLIPLAVFARRRLWSAFVLGGMLIGFAVALLAFVFPHLADAVSISQARRLVGFTPRAFAVAGGLLVLAQLLGWLVLPIALAAGVILQWLLPGDFTKPYHHLHGGPPWLTWVSFAAAGAALLVAIVGRRLVPQLERDGPLVAAAAALFVLPVAVHGYSHWSTPDSARKPLSAPLVRRPFRMCPPRNERLRARCRAARHVNPTPAQQRYRPTTRRGASRRAPLLPNHGPLAMLHRWRRLAPGRPQVRRQAAVRAAARVDEWTVRSLPSPMKVLLVTMYFPPAGGGGVQRPLKTATHLPALGIETHVLAPDDPKWLHRDEGLRPPTQAFVHRARYLGPRARLPSEELHGLEGGDLMLAKAKLAYRRALLPDASVTWLPTAVPAAVRLVKREGIDAVITTSPPNSMNLIGAAVKRLTGIPWVADLRDSVVGNADVRFDSRAVQAKEKALEQVVRLIARSADAVVAVSEPIADEVRAFDPAGQVRVIPNGCDFDDFAGLEYRSGERFRFTHTGSFFGKRDPRPFLSALAASGLEDVVARFAGDFKAADREWVEELGLGDRLELLPYLPHRELELQRDSGEPAAAAEAARGAARGAERQDLRVPRGRAADPGRSAGRTAPPPSSSETGAGSWSPPTTSAACARRCWACTRAGAPGSCRTVT